MKTRTMIIACCALLLTAAGCNKDKTAKLQGKVEPPQWEVITDQDMASSMTAVICVNLHTTYSDNQLRHYTPSENDMLAAVTHDGQCIGLAKPTESDNLYTYYLYMVSPVSQSATSYKPTDKYTSQVEIAPDDIFLYYYSATLKNLFVASGIIRFANDTHLGSVSQPYQPAFRLAD